MKAQNGQFMPDPNGIQNQLLKMVEAGETSRKAMAEATGVTQKQVSKALCNMVARDLIEACGEIPGRKSPIKIYCIKDKTARFFFRTGPINSVFALAA